MKKTLALASIALMAASLTACGGDDDSKGDDKASGGSYCDSAQDLKDSFPGLDISTMDDAKFTEFNDSLQGVADAAPADVKEQWSSISSFFSQIQDQLSDAGMTMSQFAEAATDPTKVPEGIDPAKVQELMTTLSTIGTDFETATTAIDTQLEKECGFTMDDTSTETSDAPAS